MIRSFSGNLDSPCPGRSNSRVECPRDCISFAIKFREVWFCRSPWMKIAG